MLKAFRASCLTKFFVTVRYKKGLILKSSGYVPAVKCCQVQFKKWQQTMEKQRKYSFLLRNLHLIGGVAFILALVLGLVMEDMERGPEKFQLMFFHKSLGLAVLGLAALRLLEWMRSSQPGALDSHAKWEQLSSKVVKVGLYGVMILLPVSGVMMSWYGGYPVGFFGLFELAPMVDKNPNIHEFLEEVQ